MTPAPRARSPRRKVELVTCPRCDYIFAPYYEVLPVAKPTAAKRKRKGATK